MVIQSGSQGRLPGPPESREEVSPGDYVSEGRIQKSLGCMIRDFVNEKQRRKYIKVLVPLVNKIFGTGYSTLRHLKDTRISAAAFRDRFCEILNSRKVSDLGGLDKDDILTVAYGMIKKVYESIPPDYFRSQPNSFHKPVCIIGAGAAGLYTAMILDDFGIKYEILEAFDRHGGRIFTKKLEAGATGLHEYFDVEDIDDGSDIQVIRQTRSRTRRQAHPLQFTWTE